MQFDAMTGDDDGAVEGVKRKLIDDFAGWLGERPHPEADAGDINLLLDWKYHYADGDFASWTREDVDDYLLEHVPRKLSATSDEAASIPASVGAFVHYLADRGLLSASSEAADLVAIRAVAQRQAFLDAMDDPANWGMAKRFFANSGLGDVDGLDQADLDAALARFNALSRDERDRVLGGLPGGFEPDDEESPLVPLPLRPLPSREEVETAAEDVPLLRQVDALHAALGTEAVRLTEDDNPSIADGLRLVAEVGTADRVEGVRSSAELPLLYAVAKVAGEAGAMEEVDRVLRAAPGWSALSTSTRWERIVEAVIECGASTLAFGAAQPTDLQLATPADDAALHFVGVLWMADGRLPFDVLAETVYAVAVHGPSAPVGRLPDRPELRHLSRARAAEVVASLAATGIVAADGDEVELLPAGAAVIAPILERSGYIVLSCSDLTDLSASALLDLVVDRGDLPDVVAGCWGSAQERTRFAAELVAELATESDPGRVLYGVGILAAFGQDAVPALRAAVDTPIGPQAWLLLVSAGAVTMDEVPAGMIVQAGVETFLGMAGAGSPADVIESMLGHLPGDGHSAFIDQLAGTDHPRTADLLELIGRHHPDKATAKHARKTAHRWRSRHAVSKMR